MNGKINKQLAQQIVTAIYEVVKKDINFINAQGIVIASTAPNRIGTFHKAGFEAAKYKKSSVVTMDEEKNGVKKGVNYPIIVDEALFGVIGISGIPKEVSQYGFLVTKITEVFIKEQILKENYESIHLKNQYIIKSLIYNEIQNKPLFEKLLFERGLIKENDYGVLFIHIDTKHDIEAQEQIKFLFKKAEIGLFMYTYPNLYISIVNEKEARKFEKYALYEKETYFWSGMGTMGDIFYIWQSYQWAQIALKHSMKNNTVFSSMYDLDIALIIESVDESIKKQYVSKVLKNLNEEQRIILKHYFAHNLSLKETAEAFYIHKNSLQYRLYKIKEKTGLDPRVFQEAVILYMALLLS